MRTVIQWVLALAMTFISGPLWAQAVTKHPRVVELEKNLTKEALDFLRGRFPGHPFMVSVFIDPLFRESRGAARQRENLPYYESVDVEIADEWDDPSLSNATLMNRVKKIQVILSIPSKLTDDEIAELKQSIVSNLGLLEARDNVEVRKRVFSGNEVKDDKTLTYLGWGAVIWLAFMLGLIAVVWLSAKKIAEALAKEKSKQENQSGAMSAMAPMSATSIPEARQENSSGGLSGDVRFNDPIKTREVISATVKRLEEHAGFPTLEDMIILHKFSEENPRSLGALLAEFPYEISHKIFSYSWGKSWLEGAYDPGDVDPESMRVLNKLIRLQRDEIDKDMQELLILVWRLDEKQLQFLRSISSAEAMSILYQLPSSIAILNAREVFPGRWATLLDKSFKVEKFHKERIEQLKAQALDLVPLRDNNIIVGYKHDKELLHYLRIADPSAEKEIYMASANIEALETLRPPFYKVFELAEDLYEKFVPRVSIEDWSLAMFDIARSERRNIEKRFSDKQRFRYFELLKSYDSQNTLSQKNRTGEARERIGKLLSAFLKLEAKQKAPELVPEKTEEEDNKVKAA